MPHTMFSPWFSLAANCLETRDLPTLVIDGKGTIILVSRRAESLLERANEELVGSSWVSALVALPDSARARQLEQELLTGHRPSATLETKTRSGATLALEIARVPGSVLLFTIELRELSATDHEALHGISFIEQIELHLRDERKFEIASATGRAPLSGKICYAALFDRDTPCQECPLSDEGRDESSRVTVVRAEGKYHVLRASYTERETAIVTRQVIDDELCQQLVTARLGTLAERAGLSRQERNVLDLIVLGRSHGDIAEALAIAERTVRFHQANLLAKLGADSRADLIRLLV